MVKVARACQRCNRTRLVRTPRPNRRIIPAGAMKSTYTATTTVDRTMAPTSTQNAAVGPTPAHSQPAVPA